MIKINIRKKLLLFLLLVAFATFIAMLPLPAYAATIPPIGCDFFGNELQADTLKQGDVISAVDPDGIVTGAFTATTDGSYGYLTSIGDDVETSSIDEGALEDDAISFYLNGMFIPNTGIWHEGEAVRVDIGIPSDSKDNAYQFLYDQMDKYILPGEEDVPRLVESF